MGLYLYLIYFMHFFLKSVKDSCVDILQYNVLDARNSCASCADKEGPLHWCMDRYAHVKEASAFNHLPTASRTYTSAEWHRPLADRCHN